MKKKEAQPVGDLVSMYMRSQGLETPLNEIRAINAWPQVAGKAVANATGDVKIFNQTLFVEIKSPALRNNLFLRRMELVKKINELVGTDVISNIVFK